MSQQNHYKVWFNWLFDGNIKSPIPKGEKIPNILKYNSPITHTYVISLFINNGSLNWFLNKYFNNISLRYLDKEELFYFVKKCVIDFRVKRNSIPFISYRKNSTLFNSLKKKISVLKDSDVSLLCELIKKSGDTQIYSSLGIDKPKKRKLSWNKQKNNNTNKISLLDFLSSNFSIIEI